MITKYVRTKEHVYKRLFADKAIINESGYGTCDKELNPIGETIIKESDDLSELCDAFIDTSELETTNTGGWLYDEFDSKNKCLVYYAEDERRTIPLNEFDDLSKIYGAIWIIDENGAPTLKPVSKVNEKGELELIWLKN